jgi:hypothetical protein
MGGTLSMTEAAVELSEQRCNVNSESRQQPRIPLDVHTFGKLPGSAPQSVRPALDELEYLLLRNLHAFHTRTPHPGRRMPHESICAADDELDLNWWYGSGAQPLRTNGKKAQVRRVTVIRPGYEGTRATAVSVRARPSRVGRRAKGSATMGSMEGIG